MTEVNILLDLRLNILAKFFLIYFFGMTIKKMVQKRVLYAILHARLHKGHNAHITHIMLVVTGSTFFGFTSAVCRVCRSVGCG